MERARFALLVMTLALALSLAPAARVAALDLDSILRGSTFSSTERDELTSIFARADQARIPRDLLLSRLAEGIAKKVAFPRLVQVLDASRRYLESARVTLQDAPGGAVILTDLPSWSLTATLLESGAREQEISAFCAAAEGRAGSYRNGGLLYASLVGWGVSRPASLDVARAAIRSALPPDQFPGLVSLFEQGRQKRISPDRVAERIVDNLPGVKTVDDLRRAILY